MLLCLPCFPGPRLNELEEGAPDTGRGGIPAPACQIVSMRGPRDKGKRGHLADPSDTTLPYSLLSSVQCQSQVSTTFIKLCVYRRAEQAYFVLQAPSVP